MSGDNLWPICVGLFFCLLLWDPLTRLLVSCLLLKVLQTEMKFKASETWILNFYRFLLPQNCKWQASDGGCFKLGADFGIWWVKFRLSLRELNREPGPAWMVREMVNVGCGSGQLRIGSIGGLGLRLEDNYLLRLARTTAGYCDYLNMTSHSEEHTHTGEDGALRGVINFWQSRGSEILRGSSDSWSGRGLSHG